MKKVRSIKKLILGRSMFYSILLLLIIGLMNFLSYSATYSNNFRFELEKIFNDTIKTRTKDEYQKLNPPPNYNTRIASRLNHKVRILCVVMTQPQYHEARAVHVKNTWGRRCDKLLFMSSINDIMLPSIDLGLDDVYNKLWGKTKKAFKYVYDNYVEEFDWFMKADDDSYFILENLRYFLSIYNTDEDSVYFGHKYKLNDKQGFMDGDNIGTGKASTFLMSENPQFSAVSPRMLNLKSQNQYKIKDAFKFMRGGYILSRKSLKLFIKKALPNATLCRQDDATHQEDLEMGKCLANVGVMAGDTRDDQKRGTIFHFDAGTHLMLGRVPKEHRGYSYYPIANGTECCSDLAISFHWIEPLMMYELDYLIYRLHPFGIQYSDHYPPPLPPDIESIPKRVVQNYPEYLQKIPA